MGICRTLGVGAAALGAALILAAPPVPASPTAPAASEAAWSAGTPAEEVRTIPARTPGFNGPVRAIAHLGSRVYVGGEFTRATDATGTKVRKHAAAFDASTGKLLRWNPRVDGRVLDLLVLGRTVYLAGDFTRVRGHSRPKVARLSASGKGRVLRFRHRIDGGVTALSAYGKRLYVGGSFTTVDRKARGQLAAFSRRGKLTRWSPVARKGAVYDLAATSSGIYLAGNFHQVNGVPGSRRLALVDSTGGALIGAFDPPVDKPIFEIAVSGPSVVAAAGGTGGGYVAAFARANGAQRWLRRFDGDVAALALHRGDIHVGGHFDAVCDIDSANPVNGDCLGTQQVRHKIAALTLAGALLPWNPGANSVRGVMTVHSLDALGLAIGGDFTIAGGEPRRRIAILP